MEEDVYYIALSDLKAIEKNYVVALTEASNDKLYKELKKDLDTVATMQRKIFNKMNDKGYYNLKCASDKELNALCDELNNKYNNILEEA